MDIEPTKHVNGRLWPPGVSGNPNASLLFFNVEAAKTEENL